MSLKYLTAFRKKQSLLQEKNAFYSPRHVDSDKLSLTEELSLANVLIAVRPVSIRKILLNLKIYVLYLLCYHLICDVYIVKL